MAGSVGPDIEEVGKKIQQDKNRVASLSVEDNYQDCVNLHIEHAYKNQTLNEKILNSQAEKIAAYEKGLQACRLAGQARRRYVCGFGTCKRNLE